MLITMFQVALGGAIGSVARFATGVVVTRGLGAGGFPLGVLTVNVLGSFLMGALVVYLGQRGLAALNPFLMTGVLGGFTTFSAFSLETLTSGRARPDRAGGALCRAVGRRIAPGDFRRGADHARGAGMSGVTTRTVAAGEGDQRLDRWLKRHFPQITQGRIEKGCRKGEIRVDGGRVKASTRLDAGQQVRVPPLPDSKAPARPRTVSRRPTPA